MAEEHETDLAHFDSTLNLVISNVDQRVRLMNYQPLFAHQITVLREAHDFFFSQAVSPEGVQWPPLAESTKKRKGHDTIMVDTGRLRDSLTIFTTDTVQEVNAGMGTDRPELIWGTSVPYSKYHFEATDTRPARPHVGMTELMTTEFMELVADQTVKQLNEDRRIP